MSVLSEVTAYLSSYGGIGTSGVDLFYGVMTEAMPSAMGLVQLYGGLPDEPNLGDVNANVGSNFGRATRLEFPRIQILFRGVRQDTDGPLAKATLARAALMKVVGITLSGVRYLSIEPLQPPYRLRTDSNFREEYIFNCQVFKELS